MAEELDGLLGDPVDCSVAVAAFQDRTGQVRAGGWLALGGNVLRDGSTWERCRQSPSDRHDSTMSGPRWVRRDDRAESMMVGSSVMKSEGEGPDKRGVW